MQGKRIKELRMRLNLSQERFAQLLNVSLQTIRRWEGGISRPLPFITIKLEELQKKVNETQSRKEGINLEEKGRKIGEGIGIEIGLGGMFKGISGLFDLISKMSEEGKGEEKRFGEKEILGGKGKAVYGFSVRVGMSGKPIIESFGNLRTTRAGTVVGEVREPLVDIFDEVNEILVNAEMPGVAEENINIEIKGDILVIAAESGERKYQKEILLPSQVEPRAQSKSYQNGILELKLKKIK